MTEFYDKSHRYEEVLGLCPRKKKELEQLLLAESPTVALLVKILYGQMPITDSISLPCEGILRHVKGVLAAAENFAHCHIPTDVFYDYLLPYRVNDEAFEEYSQVFGPQLAPLVAGKTMEQGALAVNYWCLSRVTYRSTDERTLGPVSTGEIGFGRCGEESVFTVAALRSAGIPARQCYVPFWGHCDDNHAWVEFWAEGQWHYMGACEPQTHSNVGWFNYAASKAPVVRHRVLGQMGNGVTADQNRLFVTKTTTELYGTTNKLEITVKNRSRVAVGIYVINYGRPSLIVQALTDEQGKATVHLGIGSYLVFTGEPGEYDLQAVNLSICNMVTLDPANCPSQLTFDLVPPHGTLPDLEQSNRAEHLEKVQVANRERGENARQENPEIATFMGLAYLTETQKQRVIKTLTPKDFADVTAAVLADMALAFQGQEGNCAGFFDKFVLPMRVENEPLYPQRAFIKAFFKGIEPKSPQQVYSFLLLNTKTVDSLAYPGLTGDVKGALTHKIVTSHTLPIHFVQICRAFGWPTRLNPQDGSPEFFDGSTFVSLFTQQDRTMMVHLENDSGKPLIFGRDITVSAMTEGDFSPLNFVGTVGKTRRIALSQGTYALCSTTRQIDGSVTGMVHIIEGQTTVKILPNPDKTAEKLVNAPIPQGKIGQTDFHSLLTSKTILAFVENGAEPTEHFLLELLENKALLTEKAISVVMIGQNQEQNHTMSQVLTQNIARLYWGESGDLLSKLRHTMEVGDERLPFITAIEQGKGLFGFANYNVGTVKTLMDIL